MTTSHPASLSPLPPPTLPPPRRGWWSRNWKWFLPVGCLLPIILCGGFITTVLMIVMGSIKASEPYQHAIAQANANAAVTAAIGTPIKAGYFPVGTISISNGSGDANLTIPISGPKGSGVIHVIATKSNGVWTYSRLTFRTPNSSEPIDLSAP